MIGNELVWALLQWLHFSFPEPTDRGSACEIIAYNGPATVGPVRMKDYQAQLEKLRRDAAECKLISDLATLPAKRELFDRLSTHLGILADQVEEAMLHGDLKSGPEAIKAVSFGGLVGLR